MPSCSWHAVHLQFPGLLSAQRKVSIIEKLACSRSAPSPRCWASAGPALLLDADRHLPCVSVFVGGWSFACVVWGNLCGLETKNRHTCIQAVRVNIITVRPISEVRGAPMYWIRAVCQETKSYLQFTRLLQWAFPMKILLIWLDIWLNRFTLGLCEFSWVMFSHFNRHLCVWEFYMRAKDFPT